MTAVGIAILAFSEIERDARVLRQMSYLSQHFPLTVLGYGDRSAVIDVKVQMLSIKRAERWRQRVRKLLLLPLGKIWPEWAYEAVYWGQPDHQTALSLLLSRSPRAIHANDWDTLPIAAKAGSKTGACIVLDLHEYAPLQSENRWYWKVFYSPMIDYILKKYIPFVSASVTVNEIIRQKYRTEYGLQPLVVMNAPQHSGDSTFRATDVSNIRLIHHGVAARDRKLELMICAVAHADVRYELHFMLIKRSRGYIAELEALAQRLAPGRVFFHPPVRPHQIIDKLSEFDMGIYILPFTNFNQAAALPNKFFDFVAAGLAVCVGPSMEMARLTQQFEFGLVAPSFEPLEVAEALNSLSACDVDRMKQAALEARNVLNAEVEMKKLVDLYVDLLE